MSKKILIAEDDADISMIEEVYLEGAGYQVKVTADGREVTSLLQEESFDLLLLDVMLPGRSGYEICREIREQRKMDIPILMVTARTESLDKIRGLGVGADDYISKPFDPAELVARVHANLRQYERLTKKEYTDRAKQKRDLHAWSAYFDRQLESIQRRGRDQISKP